MRNKHTVAPRVRLRLAQPAQAEVRVVEAHASSNLVSRVPDNVLTQHRVI